MEVSKFRSCLSEPSWYVTDEWTTQGTGSMGNRGQQGEWDMLALAGGGTDQNRSIHPSRAENVCSSVSDWILGTLSVAR